MKKYGNPEKATPVDDEIIEQHVIKTGKSITDLNEEEKEELWEELDNAKE